MLWFERSYDGNLFFDKDGGGGSEDGDGDEGGKKPKGGGADDLTKLSKEELIAKVEKEKKRVDEKQSFLDKKLQESSEAHAVEMSNVNSQIDDLKSGMEKIRDSKIETEGDKKYQETRSNLNNEQNELLAKLDTEGEMTRGEEARINRKINAIDIKVADLDREHSERVKTSTEGKIKEEGIRIAGDLMYNAVKKAKGADFNDAYIAKLKQVRTTHQLATLLDAHHFIDKADLTAKNEEMSKKIEEMQKTSDARDKSLDGGKQHIDKDGNEKPSRDTSLDPVKPDGDEKPLPPTLRQASRKLLNDPAKKAKHGIT